MRIMLIWPDGRPEVKIVIDALQKEHEILYWVGEQPVSHLTPTGAIFHDHYDAWEGRPAEAYAGVVIDPPSAKTIASMHDTESMILTMMDKHFGALHVDERKHIYYAQLGYWSRVVDDLKPDFIVFSLIPHTLYNSTLYEIARARGIPTLCFEDTWVTRHTLMYDDFRKGSDGIRRELFALANTPISVSDLPVDLQTYWSEQTTQHARTQPVYMTYQQNRGEGWGLFQHRLRVARKALQDGKLLNLLIRRVRRLGKKNLSIEYAEVVQKTDWSLPFVYFPLGTQPERTASPQGGIYADQILAAETLAAALPEGSELWIKEHPSQWWLHSENYSSARYPGYYHRLAKIPKVRIVPIQTDTFELTERSKTTAVMTGTAGWEALLRSKRPLVFGSPWFVDCPGVLRVDSVESSREAFATFQKDPLVSKEDVLRFLKALDVSSIHASLETTLKPRPTHEEEENMRRIAEAMSKRLRA